jgi:peptidoglycan/LPS O-acetylase OafA/YrhL
MKSSRIRSAVSSYQRIDYLDALRGIAALMVVFYHYLNWHWQETLPAQLASIIFNGADAVSFFFVLSGFVLSYKYFQLNAQLHVGRFLFKRIFRLYPAYIVTVIVCLGYWVSASTWDETLSRILTRNYGPVWAELSMVMQQHSFYVPGWTLGVEMRYSLLIPIFVFATRWKSISIWLILIISVCFHRELNAQFLLHFSLGALMAFFLKNIQNLGGIAKLLHKWRYLLLLAAFLLFNLRHLDHILGMPTGFDKFIQWTGLGFFQLSAMASAGMIYLVLIIKSWQRILSHPLLLYFGKISYGIYLAHWVFVFSIMEHYQELVSWSQLPNWLGFGFFLLLTLSLTIFSAHLMYKYIELPMIKWSKLKSQNWKIFIKKK